MREGAPKLLSSRVENLSTAAKTALRKSAPNAIDACALK